MNTASKIYGLAVLLAILFSGWPKGVAAASQSRAAGVLLQRFETVFNSRADLLSDSRASKNLSKQDANTLRIPFAYLIGALDSLGNGAAAEVLANSEAVLVGAKDFRPPAGLGGVRSRSCYVVVFRSGSTFDFRKYFHQSPVASAGEIPAWNWSAKLGEFGERDPRPSSLYATQVAQAYALVSNDLEELQIVAKRLTSAGTDSQNLSEIREWASVSQHDVWGYRRYHQTGISHLTAAGTTDVTPTAEALIFFFDLGKKAGVLRLLASDDSTAKKINAEAKLSSLRPISSGVWEASIPLSGDATTSERMGATMWLFGFGLYL
jgi:hypothetical protein